MLFVGAVSGLNIYVYALVGVSFPYGGVAHAVLFGVSTVGGIMILKVVLDLIANDFIEEFLLKRRIDSYWNRKANDEENRKRVRESLLQFQQAYYQNQQMQQNVVVQPVNDNTLSPTFLTQFQE
tara:strand:+ start:1103 stop:1474 length:372 start_codon:yes stop_codon:yes gene_type:complete